MPEVYISGPYWKFMRQRLALSEGLRYLQGRYPVIGDVRGLGLMQAIEIIKPRAVKDTKNKPLRDKIIQAAFERGLLILGCGENSIRFCPSLVITQEQVNCAIAILDDCFRNVR